MSDSDSDDEGVVIISRKRQNAILDDSDSDADFDADNDVAERNVTKSRNVIASDDDDVEDALVDGGDKSDNEIETNTLSSGKSEESPERNDDAVDVDPSNNEQDDEENPTPEINDSLSQPSRLHTNDLFDAELDSDSDRSDNDSVHNSFDDERERRVSDEGASGDDGDDVGELSAALKKRLKKGASKKSQSEKPRRPKKEDIKEIHSESQRLIRESSVRLPYHKPEKVGLSVFLARTQQKQQQLQSNKLGLAWKNTPEIKPDIKPKLTNSVTTSKQKAIEINKNSVALEPKTNLCDIEAVDKVKKDIGGDLDEVIDGDFDNLPDLIMEEKSTNVQYEIVSEQEMTVDKNESNIQLEGDKSKIEESGYISLPTSEEENSGDVLKKVDTLDEQAENEDSLTDVPTLSCTPTLECSRNRQNSLLTPKIANLNLDSLAPKLSGDPDSFIDLDEEEEDNKPKIPAGLEKLMERVIKHSAKRPCRKAVDVEISCISKEHVEDDRTELKLSKVTYHQGDQEEGPTSPNQKPGGKLLHLKEKLQEQMRVKRQEARLKRVAVHTMDNEEGYEDELEAALDDEAELTDQSETDDDEDEIDEEELLAQNEENEERRDTKRNLFVDDEAEDEDDDEDMDTEDNLHLELAMVDDDGDDYSDDDDGTSTRDTHARSNSSSRKDFSQRTLQKTKTLDLFDEDANTESPKMSQNSNQALEINSRPFQELSGSSTKTLVLEDVLINNDDDILMLETQSVRSETTSSIMTRDTSLLSADSSFDGTLIPAGQRNRTKNTSNDRMTPELFTPFSKSSAAKGKRSDLALAVEDSQDLLVLTPSQSQNSPIGFQFHLEETNQSQMLDEDGLFKVKSDKKPARRQLMLDTRGLSNQSSQDELLGLCSGQFTGDSSTSKNLFGGETQSPDNNMDELLGLCSGQFTGGTQSGGILSTQPVIFGSLLGTGPFIPSTSEKPSQKPASGKKRRRVVVEEDSNDSFILASVGEEDDYNKENILSDDDVGDDNDDDDDGENEDDDGDGNEDSEDEELEQARKFKGFKQNKTGKMRQEFVDEEAELSGSELESDEDLDIAEKDDYLMLEDGDMDDVGTEEDLREQVGRVHLKSVIDEDKRELRLIQEMYLQDGDLHSDGSGRQRRFKWRNIDDESQQDLFGKSDDEEGEEGLEDQAWRVARFERETFLNEQKENEKMNDEAPHVLKLGKVTFKNKKDNNIPVAEKAKSDIAKSKTSSNPAKETFMKPRIPSHGSFLGRNKDALAKIVQMTKPISTMGGARQSGNFVFTALSQNDKEKMEQKPQVKRAHSTPNQPQNKRQKLERSNTIPENSIFHLMK